MTARVLKLYYINDLGLFVAMCQASDGSIYLSLCSPSVDIGDTVELHHIDFFCCS